MTDALVVQFGNYSFHFKNLILLSNRLIINWPLESLYTSEKHGDDTTGDGSESKPFKSVLKAMKAVDKEPFPRE